MSTIRRFTSIILPLCILVMAAVGDVLGQDYDHESGFFLRLSAGGGGANTEVDNGTNRLKLSGGAGEVNFAIGAIVASNLALHGTLYGWSITDPDVETNLSSGQASGDLSLGEFGAGVTYYFMPANVYISGSLGLAELRFENASFSGESGTGVGFDLSVGKEWWVGTNWGLGAALGIGLHSVPDDQANDNWSGGNVVVRFSATMN